MTLVGDPQVIFLDEPTTGLDPRSRRTMWEIIRELVADGVTILLTTQYLDEADELADRIAVLDKGRAGRRGHGGGAQAPGPRRAHRAAVRRARAGLALAAAVLPDGVPDDEALTLQVPSDGSVASLRALLDRLDRRVDRGRGA